VTPRASATVRAEPLRVAHAPRPSLVAPSAAPLASRLRRPRPLAVAIGLVIASLLLVVGGNMELASGQLRLEQVDARLTQLQSSYDATLAQVAAETSPQALAGVGGLRTSPREVLPIPSVSLRFRLAAPTLSSAPCCTLTPG
jgi:hypothetical protein